MGLTKELYFSPSDSTTIKEVKELFEELLSLDWTIDIYRNKEARTFNLKDLGWRIEYNNRKTSAGNCSMSYRRNFFGDKEYYNKRVRLSMHFLSQENNLGEGKGAEWEEVIRHELAHAIDVELRGRTSHDRNWKAVANAMLSSGRRTFSRENLEDKKLSKYTLVCDTCGKRTPSHKKKRIKSACGTCCKKHNGGRYSEEFLLRQVQNY